MQSFLSVEKDSAICCSASKKIKCPLLQYNQLVPPPGVESWKLPLIHSITAMLFRESSSLKKKLVSQLPICSFFYSTSMAAITSLLLLFYLMFCIFFILIYFFLYIVPEPVVEVSQEHRKGERKKNQNYFWVQKTIRNTFGIKTIN